MNVYVVTVTYGNRSQYVDKLLERVFSIGVTKAIVVDNKSIHESRIVLDRLACTYLSKMQLICLAENFGSAGGFKVGLQTAEAEKDCDFIWLLDDDNLPEREALSALLKEYNNRNENCCLVSLRKDRVYRKVHNISDVKRKFRPCNGFADYNILHGLRKRFLYSFTKEKLDVIPIPYGPYGGMYFHKKLLNIIGYPFEKMFLYMDDHEFSHRLVKNNLPVYLCRKSEIADMEPSWHVIKKYKIFKRFRMIIDGDDRKVYYLIRNLIFFERKYFVTNRLVYALNRFIYKFVFYSLCVILNKRDRIDFFRRASSDARSLEAVS